MVNSVMTEPRCGRVGRERGTPEWSWESVPLLTLVGMFRLWCMGFSRQPQMAYLIMEEHRLPQ